MNMSTLSSGNGSAISDNEFNFRGDGQAYADGSWNGGGADYFSDIHGSPVRSGTNAELQAWIN